MGTMTRDDLNHKLSGGGLPPLAAVRYFHGLFEKRGQYYRPDPLTDFVRDRPVTQEVVGDDQNTTLRNAAAIIAQQQMALEQAKAELAATVNQTQAVQQQAQQAVQQLQGQLQQTGQRAQQAEAGMGQAQQIQQQMGMQMAQMAQSQLVAGEQAIAAKMEATAAHRDRQDLENALLSWKSGLQQMIDQDPIQQRMQQKVMLQQQQAAAQQQAMAQQQGGEQQGGEPQGAGAQAVQKAASEENRRQAQRHIVLKLALDMARASRPFVDRGALPPKTAQSLADATRSPHQLLRPRVRPFARRHPWITLAGGLGLAGATAGAVYLVLRRLKAQDKAKRERAKRDALPATSRPPRFQGPRVPGLVTTGGRNG